MTGDRSDDGRDNVEPVAAAASKVSKDAPVRATAGPCGKIAAEASLWLLLLSRRQESLWAAVIVLLLLVVR